jgi:hypothetical protein
VRRSIALDVQLQPPGERTLGIHWIGDWVGSGAGPDAVKWRKIKQDLLLFPQIYYI